MKRFTCLILLTVMVFCCIPAQADQPAGGVLKMPTPLKSRDGQSSFISGPTVVTAGEDGVWTVDLGEDDREYFYKYRIIVDDDCAYTNASGQRLLDVLFERAVSTTPTITYGMPVHHTQILTIDRIKANPAPIGTGFLLR